MFRSSVAIDAPALVITSIATYTAMKKAAIATAFLFCATSSISAQDSYVCTVKSPSRLGDDGVLHPARGDAMKGQDFTVDRASGKMIGRYLASGGFDTKVMDGAFCPSTALP